MRIFLFLLGQGFIFYVAWKSQNWLGAIIIWLLYALGSYLIFWSHRLRWLKALLGLVCLAIILIPNQSLNNNKYMSIKDSSDIDNNNPKKIETAPQTKTVSAAKNKEYRLSGIITAIPDTNHIEINYGEIITLIGLKSINVPTTSMETSLNWLMGKEVLIDVCPHYPLDKQGFVRGEVFVEGHSLNELLLQAKLAVPGQDTPVCHIPAERWQQVVN